jgi:hypothetical protein
MSAPTVTYKAFLDTVTATIAAQYTTMKVRSTVAPRFGLPMNQPMFYVCPGDACIEYEPCDAHDKTSQAYWVWYDCRIHGLIALTDANYEDALTGSTAKSGIAKIMEDLFTFLEGNFMALSQIREVKVIWDKPAFTPASFEGEGVNMYAAMGSLIFKVRLKQVVSTTYQNTCPAITDVHAIEIGATTAKIIFTTNKLGNTKVVYGTVDNPYSLNLSATDETDCTFHSIVLTGLTASTPYYFKAQSEDQTGLLGSTADISTFSTLAGVPGGVLMVSDVAFTIRKNAITAAFNTDEPCKCTIFGKLSTEGDYAVWVIVFAEHDSPHTHQKTGLVAQSVYQVRILCVTDEGLATYQPSETGYYEMRTGPDDSTPGVILGIYI